MKKVVLLDADGVVIKDHDYFSSRYKRDYGKSLNDEVIADFFKNEYKKTAVGKADLKELLGKKLNEWGWKGTVDELLKYWLEGERELNEEVLKVVKKLKGKEIKCYLASDNEKYRAEYLLDEVGLRQHFNDTFFSCFLGHTKSEPEFFEKIIKMLGVKPEEVEYWDDDPGNVKVAKGVGIKGNVYCNFNEFRKNME
jgi:putative hydrolase of the HAD superfamily